MVDAIVKVCQVFERYARTRLFEFHLVRSRFYRLVVQFITLPLVFPLCFDIRIGGKVCACFILPQFLTELIGTQNNWPFIHKNTLFYTMLKNDSPLTR